MNLKTMVQYFISRSEVGLFRHTMAKFVGFLFTVLIIIKFLNLPATAKILPQYELKYSNCIQQVFQKQFSGSSVSVVLPKFSEKISDAFVKTLHGLHTVTIVDKTKKPNASPPLYKPINFLFLISSRLDLIHSIKYLKSATMWNPAARVLVILNNEMVHAKINSLVNMSEMKKIFRVFMKERSVQVNLIVFDEQNIPKLFAWFPFDDDNNCSNRVKIIHPVGECRSDGKATKDGFLIKTNLSDLPIMPRTFNQCPLTVTALKMEPYTVCSNERTCDNGIEIRLFECVSRSLQLSLKLNIEEKVDETIYNKLLGRELDLLIGGINPLTKIRNKRFTQTVPYFQDELTWCVREAKTINLWLTFFLIFDAQTWGYFVLTTTIAGTALYYFYKFYHHQENWCYCAAVGFFVAISLSVPINPTHTMLRIYFIILCLYGLVLTTTFNSFLMSAITEPVQFRQISTKQNLIENSVRLYAENSTMALYRSDENELSEYFLQNFRSCSDTNSCLETFLSSSSDDIAVAAPRQHAMNYPMINDLKIFCFQKPETIYVYPVAALANEHFHLLDTINRQIQYVVETGLISKWESDSRTKKKPKILHNTVSPFSFHNISACIVALMVGFTGAFIGFALELFFSAKKRSARNSQPVMWRVCEKIWVTQERDAWPEIIRYYRWKVRTNQ